jgi:hypothetical protein
MTLLRYGFCFGTGPTTQIAAEYSKEIMSVRIMGGYTSSAEFSGIRDILEEASWLETQFRRCET